MRRLLRRLAWRNLPIALKAGALFALELVFVLATVLAIQIAFTSLRSALATGGTTTVDMRALSQDLQLNVEATQRLEARLVEQQFGWGAFNLIENSMRTDHSNLTTQIINNSTHLEALAGTIVSPTDLVPFSIEVRTIQTNARTSEQTFSQILDLVHQLTWPDEGAIPQLQAVGDQLQAQTILQDNTDMTRQLILMRNLENTLASTGAQSDRQALQDAASQYLAIYSGIALASRVNTIPRTLEDYLTHASQVATLRGQLQTAYQSSQLATQAGRDATSRLGTVTEAQRQTQLTRIATIQDNAGRIVLIGLVVTLIAGVAIAVFFARDLARSSQALLEVAGQLEAGDLSARAEVRGEDEFSRLASSFNGMADQIEGLVSGLEQRVAERTRDLTITGEIGRAVTALEDPRALMNEIVELIRTRFNFYHAQVFLVDDEGKNANLIASTGRAGRELLARQHFLEVGSQSVIGQVTSRGLPVVASDTNSSGIHRRNELLPDTRSEMALPMRIGDRVIGALDVQSVAPNAFDEDVVAVFQIMADQLAIALENARLYTRLNQLQENLLAQERQIAGEAWEAYHETRADQPMSFSLQGKLVGLYQGDAPTSLNEAIRSGQVITTRNGEDLSLAVPIRVRGEVIGAFGFGGGTLESLSEDDLSLVEAIVDRVGLALENLRLVEQMARRAEHEQILNEITAKIVGSTDVEQILQTTVKELGRMLGAPQTSVRLRREGA